MRKRLSVCSGRFSEEEMDRNIGSERAWPSVRSERFSQGEALILILLLSFGFWGTIWGAITLLAVGGR
jgi:hypothetical protein